MEGDLRTEPLWEVCRCLNRCTLRMQDVDLQRHVGERLDFWRRCLGPRRVLLMCLSFSCHQRLSNDGRPANHTGEVLHRGGTIDVPPLALIPRLYKHLPGVKVYTQGVSAAAFFPVMRPNVSIVALSAVPLPG
jgi:hypothetical protein